MKIYKLLFAFIIIKVLQVCSAYNILTLYPYNGKSHFVLLKELSKGLVRKGHKVDIISPFPQKKEMDNLTQIITLPSSQNKGFVSQVNFDTIKTFNLDLSWMYSIGIETCRHLDNPDFLELARKSPNNPPYDAILVTVGMSNCFMILAHLWKIPLIFIHTSSLYPWMHDTVGNPENIAISTNNMYNVPYTEGTFLWRFYNAYVFYYLKFNYWWRTKPHDELARKHWPDAPSIQQLERNTSLILMNTYFPINGIKPMAKNVIEIGGIHVPEIDAPKLDPDLKKWLDESKSGVIYFTFGTMFRIETFPDETLKIIFGALEKLAPVRVLLRIVEPGRLRIKLPRNFYNMSWLPQQKILQHPNTKLFITHSGLLGTQESIYYAVPMLCIPLFVDQFNNAQTYVNKKIALQLDINTITEEKIISTVDELLNNPIYRHNVKVLSRLFKDRPQSPIDTANYWIEYVIRNGRDSLRSPAMNLTWWQLNLLDVLATIIAGLLIILYLLRLTIKKILTSVYSKKINVSKDKKKT